MHKRNVNEEFPNKNKVELNQGQQMVNLQTPNRKKLLELKWKCKQMNNSQELFFFYGKKSTFEGKTRSR